MNVLRKIAAVMVAGGIVLGLTACFEAPDPTFKVIGYCTIKGGTLGAVGMNFSKSTGYYTQVTYPNGKPYLNDTPNGKTYSDGSTSSWGWPCKGDPAGTYKITAYDKSTGKHVSTTFDIHES